MSIRFRRSISLGRAFKINVSKSGLSFSAHMPGMKGLSVSSGAHGTYVNAGLPGTGLSSRTKLSDKGLGLSFRTLKDAVLGQRGEDTDAAPTRKQDAHPEEAPSPSLDEILRPFLDLHAKAPVVGPLDPDADVTEAEIEQRTEAFLSSVQVPYLFTASFEYDEHDATLRLDVDLPEIEDIPDEEEAAGKGGRTVRHRIPAAQAHAHYACCVWSLALYLAASLFAQEPGLAHIVLSGYTQRRDSKGDVKDVYIVSVRFERDGLVDKRFSATDDPAAICQSFENRCRMTSTGLFQKIVPYDGISA